MKHKQLLAMILSTILCCGVSYSFAQDAGDSSAAKTVVVRQPASEQKAQDKTGNKAKLSSMTSGQQSASMTNSKAVSLQTTQAPEYDQPAGTCPVINGLIGDYCQQQPDDIYCKTLQ